MQISKRLAKVKDRARGVSEKQKVALMLAAFVVSILGMAVLFGAGVSSPAQGVNVASDIGANTAFYGLTIIDWVFAGLAIAMLVIYFINKNPWEIASFLVLVALLVVMYVMGY
jgi:cell division protein FtsW (lipid II flippase)